MTQRNKGLLRKDRRRNATPSSRGQNAFASQASTPTPTLPSCPLPPAAVFAVFFLAVQLVALNIGVILFEGKGAGNAFSRSGAIPSKRDFLARTQTQQQQRQRRAGREAPDGSFNGHPIYHRTRKDVETFVHCVGENYQERLSWKKKSCEFKNYFCFDAATKNYVVFDAPENKAIYEHRDRHPLLDFSQSYLKMAPSEPNSVSLGGINTKWGKDTHRLEWSPEIRTMNADESLSYYELPSSVVMIPFHSMNGSNPGHLVWDDFLPIFTLLSMFQLKEKSKELMLMRYILKGNGDSKDGEGSRGLWASCDWTDEKKEACRKMYKKFLPLMLGADPVREDPVTTEEFDFRPSSDAGKSSTTLVCASHGLAGIGALTDHGTEKTHGWDQSDYQLTQNHGRGGTIYEFRNFMLRNMGIPVESHQEPPFRVVFSESSSSRDTRNFDFKKQKEFLKQNFHPSYVSVESYVFSDLSLAEQLEISSQASIFITSCGGGAVSAMFMPRGSSVIMYYVENGGIVNNKPTGTPARLDWDLFNNMAYLKVHWLPSSTMNTDADTNALFLLIQHELEGLIREKSYDHFFN